MFIYLTSLNETGRYDMQNNLLKLLEIKEIYTETD
jgi:hypothetical protein